MMIVEDGDNLLKTCPFSTNKKGERSFCYGKCALYVGQYPFGQCALYLTAINTLPKTDDEKDED